MSVFVLLITMLALEETPVEAGMVIIDACGFESNEGQAVVLLFSEGCWTFPPRIEFAGFDSTAEVSNLTVYLEIEDVPYGTYVPLIFHDTNGDGEFDMRGGEAFGISMDPFEQQDYGREAEHPAFEEISIVHDSRVTVIRVAVYTRESAANLDDSSGRGGGSGRGGSGGKF
jgi:uncharacterized protein (DUF2141 family)